MGCADPLCFQTQCPEKRLVIPVSPGDQHPAELELTQAPKLKGILHALTFFPFITNTKEVRWS